MLRHSNWCRASSLTVDDLLGNLSFCIWPCTTGRQFPENKFVENYFFDIFHH